MEAKDRDTQLLTRRDFGKLTLAAVPAGLLIGPGVTGALAQAKPNSVYGGIPIGVIGGFGDGNDAQVLLGHFRELNMSAFEVGNGTVEAYAGAPATAGGGGGGRGRGAAAPGAPAAPGAAPPAAPAGAGGAGRGAGRAAQPPPTPEQLAAQQAQTASLKNWRLSQSFAKHREWGRLFRDAGVNVYAFRFTLTEAMSDAEYDYAFQAVNAVGANQLTMELPTTAAMTKRIGDFATKHRVNVGYHTHLQSTPTVFDEAIAQSAFNGIQLDIGHYFAATSQSPIPLMQRHHARIFSIHLKDRKTAGGPNMPWGQGDTPMKEILQLMKREKWAIPSAIELEYPVPEGSTRLAEVAKCLKYAKDALA